MTRITNTIREKICRRAVAAAFSSRENALAEQSNALALEAYASVFAEAVRQQASAMPRDWMNYDSCLRFNADGWNVKLQLAEAAPVPHSSMCRTLGSLTGDLAVRVQSQATSEETLRKEKWRTEHETTGFLEQFKSFKQMRESWPEGEPFYKEFDIERPQGGVPAVRVAEINRLLNITEAA